MDHRCGKSDPVLHRLSAFACLSVHMTGDKERIEWGLWMSSELQSKELLECCRALISHPVEVPRITELRVMGIGEN